MKKKKVISHQKINFNRELLISLGIQQIKVTRDYIYSYAGHLPISAIYIYKGHVDLLKNKIIKGQYKENFIVGFSELIDHEPINFDIKFYHNSEIFFLSKENLKMLLY